jgi:hypothetical protein
MSSVTGFLPDSQVQFFVKARQQVHGIRNKRRTPSCKGEFQPAAVARPRESVMKDFRRDSADAVVSS